MAPNLQRSTSRYIGVGALASWILKIAAEKVVFLVSSRIKQISPLLARPLEKFWKNPLVSSPGKNPSDGHVKVVGVLSHVTVKRRYLGLAGNAMSL